MDTHTWDDNYDRNPLSFFVPDELCFIVTETGKESAADRYLRVLQERNADLTAVMRGVADHAALARRLAHTTPDMNASRGRSRIASALHKDLAGTRETFDYVREKLASKRDVLQPIAAPNTLKGRRLFRTPWVELSEPQGLAALTEPITTLHVYQVGDDADRAHPPELRSQRVRDLAVLYNDHFKRNGVAARATPNWLCAAAAEGCPSPGSGPVWIDKVPEGPGYWSFTFENEKAAAVVRRGRATPSAVKIAVLDTSPNASTVGETALDPRYTDNLLLQHLAMDPQVTINSPLSHPSRALTHLYDIRANWRDQSAPNGNPLPDIAFRMDDHGLFIAGIIHDIAPNAELHLIRVLNGYGVTDYHAVLAALRQLPKLLDNDKQRLVVNLSLGFSIPPGVDALRLLMRETYEALRDEFHGNIPADLTLDQAIARLSQGDAATQQALQETLDDLRTGLNEIIDWLAKHPQVLVVAAAGNDNNFFTQGVRPEPRWPAHYDGVLSVAAVGHAGQAAAYSNRADVDSTRNGVATLGGDATSQQAGDLGVIDVATDDVDAVKGIYCSAVLVPAQDTDTGTNATAWAYWSGTSFATPVIAALAANLWDWRLAERRADPHVADYNTERLIEEIITEFAGDTNDPATADLGAPTLHARQEWTTDWQGFA